MYLVKTKSTPPPGGPVVAYFGRPCYIVFDFNTARKWNQKKNKKYIQYIQYIQYLSRRALYKADSTVSKGKTEIEK